MQKKLIALAVAAISAAPAFAQSNVTIYGRIDYGYVSTSGTSGGVATSLKTKAFDAGVQGGSRLGFKGAEDLGNGLKAIFEIESGIQNDRELQTGVNGAAGAAANNLTANAGGLFSSNRHAYVGLTGNFGTVVGGRLDGVRYGIFNKYDPFAGGTVGNFTQMTAQVDRADNAVAYISPNFSGFTVTAATATHVGTDAAFTNATTQEAGGNVGDGKLYTLMANYANGPIDVSVDVERVKETKDNIGTNGKHKVATIAGSYDFGVAKVSALWDSHKANDLTTVTAGVAAATAGQVLDYRSYMLGVSAPVMGKGLVKAMWGKVNDRMPANADATKWGLGFDYSLSKRTNFYADYGKISNKNGATYNVTYLANSRATGAAGAVKGIDLGIAHKF